jgi:hypothetical protein
MKSAKDLALDIVGELSGHGFSRGMIAQMATDDSEAGRNLARMLSIIEKHVERDRKQSESRRAPS